MLIQLRRSIIAGIFFAILCGLVYPLAEIGISNVAFPARSAGSVTSYGSSEIGQQWSGTSWFHGRPDLYNDGATGGTNLGPRSRQLLSQTKKLIAFWHSNGVNPTQELVTSSGSGVDPDISPQSAFVQIPMISKATGIRESLLHQVVVANITKAQLHVFGVPYVDVLHLNIAVAKLKQRLN